MELLTNPTTLQAKTHNNFPQDLYIPPDALEIFLESFEGPLDLLLYLIRRQNIDILNIPIAEITRQYIAYIELMKEMHLDLAAEYLVMAATLAHIKSRMLLPKSDHIGEEEDPRAELVRLLQEYEQYKIAAENLDQLPRKNRDFYLATAKLLVVQEEKKLPDIHLETMLFALNQVLQRGEHHTHHQIRRETLSVRERMSRILSQLDSHDFFPFISFFEHTEGRQGIIVTFIAILELIKDAMIEIAQSKPFAPIYIRRKGNS
ncbi:MAG: segregation/condensation protein A [Gammaproteobacteria bacterium]|nr:segregation/condensation protein A [Gammaproteobacteria bacterium]